MIKDNNVEVAEYGVTVNGPEMGADESDIDPAVQFVLDLYNEYSSSDYRKEKIDAAEANRKDYDGYRAVKDFPWENCANYSLMLPAIVLDTLEPRITSAVAGRDRDIVEAIPNSRKGADLCKEVEEFAEWALLHNIKWPKEVPGWIHDLLLDGTIYIFPRYEEYTISRGERFIGEVPADPTTMQELQPEDVMARSMDGRQIGKTKVDKIVMKDKKIFRVRNACALINEVYGPDLCPDWEETPTIRKEFVKYEDLKAKSKANGGPYVNITEDLKSSEGSSPRTDDDLPMGSEKDRSQPETKQPEIEILTCYAKYEIDEGDRDWCIIGIAVATNTLIRLQYQREVYYSYPGKAVIRIPIFPDYQKQYGTGLPYKVRHYSKAMNDLLNQMIDGGTIAINPIGFYGSDAGLPDKIDISPGALNPIVGNAQSIVWQQIQLKSDALIAFINLLVSFLERLIAVSSYNAGVQDNAMGQGAGTAAGMRMILQEAAIKHTYQAKPVKESLEEVIRLDMLLYSWYMPDNFEIMMPSSKTFRTVNVDALQQDYDFTLAISDSAYNRLMARTEAVELMSTAAQLPYAESIELFKDLLSSYDKKNPERYINPNFMAMVQIMAKFPEAADVLKQYVQSKMEEQHNQELAQGAKDSVTLGQMKEKIQEPNLMQDLTKNVQKALTKEGIKKQFEFDAALEHKSQISVKDMADARASHNRRVAKDLVEGAD